MRRTKKACPRCGHVERRIKATLCEECNYNFRPVDAVADALIERCAQDEVAVVVAPNGVPSRVYGLQEYLQMQQPSRAQRPWKKRKTRVQSQIPTVQGKIIKPVTRDHMYD